MESWEDAFNLTPQVDTCILGGGMYPNYEQYWMAILADPKAVLPFGGYATNNEIIYARWADKTPHIVLSKTLKKVEWKTSRIVRDVDEIQKMKRQPRLDDVSKGAGRKEQQLIKSTKRCWRDFAKSKKRGVCQKRKVNIDIIEAFLNASMPKGKENLIREK